jgi:threonyl-tRNA synthetase
MNAKIRTAQLRKIPYMFVVGDREAEAQTISLRVRGGGNLGVISLDEVVTKLVHERDTKALTP